MLPSGIRSVTLPLPGSTLTTSPVTAPGADAGDAAGAADRRASAPAPRSVFTTISFTTRVTPLARMAISVARALSSGVAAFPVR